MQIALCLHHSCHAGRAAARSEPDGRTYAGTIAAVYVVAHY